MGVSTISIRIAIMNSQSTLINIRTALIIVECCFSCVENFVALDQRAIKVSLNARAFKKRTSANFEQVIRRKVFTFYRIMFEEAPSTT